MAERKISFFKRGVIVGVGTSLVVIGGAYCAEANSSDSGEPLSQTEGLWTPENTVKPSKRVATPTATVTLLNSPTPFDISETSPITATPLLVNPTKAPFIPTSPPILVPQPIITPFITPSATPEITMAVEGINYEWAERIFTLTNQQRVSHGLWELERNESLDRSARAYASFLFTNKLLPATDHFLDGSPTDRAIREGYNGGVGENLSSGDPVWGTVDMLFNAWMNSPGHRANILSEESGTVESGAGCYQGFYNGVTNVIVCLQEFGNPNE